MSTPTIKMVIDNFVKHLQLIKDAQPPQTEHKQEVELNKKNK